MPGEFSILTAVIFLSKADSFNQYWGTTLATRFVSALFLQVRLGLCGSIAVAVGRLAPTCQDMLEQLLR